MRGLNNACSTPEGPAGITRWSALNHFLLPSLAMPKTDRNFETRPTFAGCVLPCEKREGANQARLKNTCPFIH